MPKFVKVMPEGLHAYAAKRFKRMPSARAASAMKPYGGFRCQRERCRTRERQLTKPLASR